jgi:hypothetical protein
MGKRTRRLRASASGVGSGAGVADGAKVGWAVADGAGVTVGGASVGEAGTRVDVATWIVTGAGVSLAAEVLVAQATNANEHTNKYGRGRIAREDSREARKCRM